MALATPLIFGSLGGLLCERSGVVNIAIDGAAAVRRVLRRSGRNAGQQRVGGSAGRRDRLHAGPVLAIFSIKYRVNQVIVGVVLNVLVSGLTGFLFATVLQPNAADYNSRRHGCCTSPSRCFRDPRDRPRLSTSPSSATS